MGKEDERWMRLMNAGHFMGCHQMPSRSFFYHGYQFPICARCTGVLVGQTFAIIFIICGLRLSYHVIVILVGIMGIDWFVQRIGVLGSTNARRLITGTSCGFGLTFLYFYILRWLFYLVV